jgi:hypothetical protein
MVIVDTRGWFLFIADSNYLLLIVQLGRSVLSVTMVGPGVVTTEARHGTAVKAMLRLSP